MLWFSIHPTVYYQRILILIKLLLLNLHKPVNLVSNPHVKYIIHYNKPFIVINGTLEHAMI